MSIPQEAQDAVAAESLLTDDALADYWNNEAGSWGGTTNQGAIVMGEIEEGAHIVTGVQRVI